MASFKERYGPWAIIAGASEGIGRSFAKKIAAQGVSCILIANAGPLEEVAAEVRGEGVECLTAQIDLSRPDAAEQIIGAVGGREVGLYISVAGGDANASLFLDADIKAWVDLAHVNTITSMMACHHFGGLMKQRGRGGLLLVNSGACYGGSSYLTTYCAVKSFLLSFAEGLWSELQPHGVDVLTLVLKRTDTPNFRRIQAKVGQPVPPNIDSPDDVAEMGLARLPHGPIHNFGMADDQSGPAWDSAKVRRERVAVVSASTLNLYGKAKSG